MQVLARSAGRFGRVAAFVGNQVRELYPDLPLLPVRTVDEALGDDSLWPQRLFGSMFATW